MQDKAGGIQAAGPTRQTMSGDAVKLPEKVLLYQKKDGEWMAACGRILCGPCNPCENNDKFLVYDATNGVEVEGKQALLQLDENSGCCTRAFCGGRRGFEMVATRDGQRKFALKRKHRLKNCAGVPSALVTLCTSPLTLCWFPEIIEVKGETDEEILGKVEQRYTDGCYNDGIKICNTAVVYEIKNANNEHISDVNVDFCKSKNCCSLKPVFDIVKPRSAYAEKDVPEKPEVRANVRNQFMGIAKECCTQIENFEIDMNPADGTGNPVPEDERALHLAATILLKYTHFDSNGDN